jgi:hypothetical protein
MPKLRAVAKNRLRSIILHLVDRNGRRTTSARRGQLPRCLGAQIWLAKVSGLELKSRKDLMWGVGCWKRAVDLTSSIPIQLNARQDRLQRRQGCMDILVENFQKIPITIMNAIECLKHDEVLPGANVVTKGFVWTLSRKGQDSWGVQKKGVAAKTSYVLHHLISIVRRLEHVLESRVGMAIKAAHKTLVKQICPCRDGRLRGSRDLTVPDSKREMVSQSVQRREKEPVGKAKLFNVSIII